MSARRQRPEQSNSAQRVCAYPCARAPNLFAFHPSDGGWRSKTEARVFAGLGVQPGTPDLIIIYAGRTYGLELKADGGRLSDTQRDSTRPWRGRRDRRVADGLDEAIAWLEQHDLLRGRAT